MFLELFTEYQGQIIQGFTITTLGWIWWTVRKVFVRHEECQKCRSAIANRINELENRQQSHLNNYNNLAQKLENLPTTKDMHSLALGMTELRGDVKAMGKSLKNVEKNVDMFNEAALMERKNS